MKLEVPVDISAPEVSTDARPRDVRIETASVAVFAFLV